MRVKVTKIPNQPSQKELDKSEVPVTTGENSQQPNAELEKGEVYQDQDGGINKVSEKANLHDKGGVPLDNVHRVLEDTGDKRTDEDSRKLLMTPDEVEEKTGYRPKRKVTHSKAFELASEHYSKKVKKTERGIKKSVENYEKSGDKYAANALDVNLAMLNQIPTKSDLFDSLFSHQEEIKEIHGMDQETDTDETDLIKGKYGMELPKAQKGKGYRRRGMQQFVQRIGDDEYNKLSTEARLNAFYNDLQTMGYTGAKEIGAMQDYLFNKQHPQLASHYATTVPITNHGAEDMGFGDVDASTLTDEQRRQELTDNKFWARYFRTEPKSFPSKSDYDSFIAGKQPVTEGDKTYYTDMNDNSPRRTYYDPTYTETPQATPIETPVVTPQGYPDPYATKYQYKPTNRSPNRFNQPLQWYDVAQPLMSMANSGKVPVKAEMPEIFSPQVHLLDPRPQLYQGQADYNAAQELLPDNGVGYANVANLYAKKYELNNQVLGQYENANKAKLDQRDAYDAQRRSQQSVMDAQARDTFETRRLTRDEAQRQQKSLDVGTLTNTIALNQRFNREGKLLNGMFDYYNYNNGTGNVNRNDNPFIFNSDGSNLFSNGTTTGANNGKFKLSYVKNANGTTTVYKVYENGSTEKLVQGDPNKESGTFPKIK